MNKLLISALVGAVVVGGVSFYGGTKYSSGNDRGARVGQLANRPAGMGDTRAFRGGQGDGVVGEIISRDENGFTVKLTDGGSRLVFVSGTTEVTKTASGSLDDLTIGTQVFVTGTENSDGSTTASSVRLGGGMMFRAPVQDSN